MYICGNCRRKIEKFDTFIRCPYCSYRIMYKPSLPMARKLKAR